jgi:hypothetical protein
MGGVVILMGLALAVVIVTASTKFLDRTVRSAAVFVALIVFLASIALSSVRYVDDDQVGIVVKNALGPKLPSSKIIATEGEMGPQAAALPPGWHFWYWPVIYDVEKDYVINIEDGQVGLLTTTDGQPLPPGDIYAPEWSQEAFKGMLDAEYFLAEGGGNKGPQAFFNDTATTGSTRACTRSRSFPSPTSSRQRWGSSSRTSARWSPARRTPTSSRRGSAASGARRCFPRSTTCTRRPTR